MPPGLGEQCQQAVEVRYDEDRLGRDEFGLRVGFGGDRAVHGELAAVGLRDPGTQQQRRLDRDGPLVAEL
nr:hypothetical protein [Glycomyces buryatensis]